MNLINKEDIANAARLHGFGGELLSRLLMQFLRLNKINKVYGSLYEKEGIEFIDAVINELGIKFEVSQEDLNRIPKDKPFITVSNHPFGGIDGIILIKLLSEIRPDYKVMANFHLSKVDPINNFFLPVNPFEKRGNTESSYSGIRTSFTHLKEGYPLGIFPSGEVSTYYSDNNQICDKQWQNSVLKFIKKAEVPVVPIYFTGSNSWLFHLLGRIHPMLRSAKLPSELLNKKNKLIKIRIGNPIVVKEQSEFPDVSQYGRYLRARTYALGTPLEVRKFFKRSLKRPKKVEEIVDPFPKEKIVEEITKISKTYELFRSKSYQVLCAPSFEMPYVLQEIGRLREITFREVGEGTNRSNDLDEFDLYYHQLVIWDTEAQKIVGAYRVGKGNEIFQLYGIKGFYIQSLFRIKRDFYPIMQESIELGRSFIVKEYQKKPLSLFLLWKGILYFLLKHPELRYLIGPVSISNEFSKFSKSLMVDFIKQNHYDDEFAKLIYPRKDFFVQAEMNVDKQIFLNGGNADIGRIDRVIKDVEQSISMPVLLKKYLGLNAKIIGFNIDPKFNDALDGLIILDIYEVPRNVIESLVKEINDEKLLERFTAPEHNELVFKGK
jgi:putative hemolysin